MLIEAVGDTELALDAWVVLIGACVRGCSFEDVNDHLAVLLGGQFKSLPLPPRTSQVEKLLEHMRSDEIASVWSDVYSVSVLYRYFCDPDLDVFRTSGQSKVPQHLIGRRTQQFTDRWIAEFLVQNTIGRMWVQMHRDSTLADEMSWLVPLADCASGPLKLVRDIKILDPACGTMNFGICAIELLYKMYQEELVNAGGGGWPERASVNSASEIHRAILTHNIFGIDVDHRPLALAALMLTGRSDHDTQLNLTLANTLEVDHPGVYDVVLLNPPYLDRRDYVDPVRKFMKRRYPRSGRNLYTAFLERSLKLVCPGGRLGAVTPQTFMFIGSFEPVRRWLAENAAIETLAHTGLNTFDDAVVDCAFYVLQRGGSRRSVFFRLTHHGKPADKKRWLQDVLKSLTDGEDDQRVFHASQDKFHLLPRSPWVYWITDGIRSIFQSLSQLADHAEIRQGLATTDNARFVRLWWELPTGAVIDNCKSIDEAKRSGGRWFRYAKGGGFRRWYSVPEYAVDWADDGRAIKNQIVTRYPYLNGKWEWVAKNIDYYFKPALTYSYLTSRKFSARIMPGGAIFDVAGSSVFADDPLLMLAVLNSRMCSYLLALINSTVNFQIGDLTHLPVPSESTDELTKLTLRAIELEKTLEAFDETSPEFIEPPPWTTGVETILQIYGELDDIQKRIDCQVYDLYGVSDDDIAVIEQFGQVEVPAERIDRKELAYRWISYALGIAFGRFDMDSIAPNSSLNSPHTPVNVAADAVMAILGLLIGTKNVDGLIVELPSPSLEKYLIGPFAVRHNMHYRSRPIYWAMADELTYYHNLDVDFNDGVMLNLVPYRRRLSDSQLKYRVEKYYKDLLKGKYAWSTLSKSVRNSEFR